MAANSPGPMTANADSAVASLRGQNRSARIPPIGLPNRLGPKETRAKIPTLMALPVRLYTSQPEATNCIEVPNEEKALTKTIRRNALYAQVPWANGVMSASPTARRYCEPSGDVGLERRRGGFCSPSGCTTVTGLRDEE